MTMGNIDISAAREAAQQTHETVANANRQANAIIEATNATTERIKTTTIDISAALKTAQSVRETVANANNQVNAAIAAVNSATERIKAIPPTNNMAEFDAALAAAIRGN